MSAELLLGLLRVRPAHQPISGPRGSRRAAAQTPGKCRPGVAAAEAESTPGELLRIPGASRLVTSSLCAGPAGGLESRSPLPARVRWPPETANPSLLLGLAGWVFQALPNSKICTVETRSVRGVLAGLGSGTSDISQMVSGGNGSKECAEEGGGERKEGEAVAKNGKNCCLKERRPRFLKLS